MAKKKTTKTAKAAVKQKREAGRELALRGVAIPDVIEPDIAGLRKAARAVADAIGDMGTVEKAFLTGNAAVMPGQGAAKMPGTSWSNQGNAASSLIQQITSKFSAQFGAAPAEVELALADAGLSWGPPFPPGRPLDPFWAYRGQARTWDFSVGENVQVTPRWDRISFQTIKAIYEAYDVAQICVRHLINDVRSLDYAFVPPKNCKTDVSGDIETAEEFFESPDGRQPFESWIAEWMQDILRYDAGALYIHRLNNMDPFALEVVSGTSIIPLIDFYGRPPVDSDADDSFEIELQDGKGVTPAFVQIIQGMPFNWLTMDDMIYLPWNPLPESQYGLAPLEAVLLSANTDIRFQWHFLQFFTEGTLPAGFMEAPPDMSDPAQLADWENNWNAVMLGDQAKLRQIRWVPAGAKFTPAKADADRFTAEFPLYLMRRTCASFGVTPNDLGFTENVNRATGDTQIDVQFRVGTLPLLRHIEAVINLFLAKCLGLRARIQFDDGRETEDRVATAQAHQVYISCGVESPDEVRQELGKPIDKERPVPRVIINPRIGPIPLLSVLSMSGEVDPETFSVAEGQELVSTPYIAPPGPIPQQGTPEQLASAQTSAEAANEMIEATTGSKPPRQEALAAPTPPAPQEVTKENWREILSQIDAYEAAKKGVDNTGGPGVHGALTFSTGVQGVDLEDEADDIENEVTKAALLALDLRRWRTNTLKRMKKGQAPKRFTSLHLPAEVVDGVWGHLEGATTPMQVDVVFKAVDKAMGSWLDSQDS